MEIKTVMAIVEALGEGIVKKQDGIDNCLAHIAQLDSINQRLIEENKKMKEEILSLKSEDTAPVKVADISEEVCRGVGEMGYCEGDCCPDGANYCPDSVDG